MNPYDEERLKANIVTGKPLCEHCEGTGNQFYSMYSACPVCGGSGLTPDAADGMVRFCENHDRKYVDECPECRDGIPSRR